MPNWKLTKHFDFRGRAVKWDVRGSGPPLIVVHGTPWSSFNMRHLIDGLSDAFEVFYYDLLGYGASDKSEGDVSLGIQNEVLASLIDHWGIEFPIAVGHDFGGATILRTHLLNKKDFKKLVLIDPVALSHWGSPFFRHVHKYEAAFAGMPDYIHKAIVETYVKSAAYREIPPDTLEGILRPWTTHEGKSAFYRQIAQSDSRFTDEIQDLYSSIQVPTLILWGEKDEWISIEKGKQLHKLLPHSQLEIIPQCGHLVIEEAPERLIAAIKKVFLI